MSRVSPSDYVGAMQRSNVSGSRSAAQGSGASEVPGSGAKKPRASAFYQQRLPAWNPVLTPGIIYLVLISTGLLFIALGLALYFANASVVELKYQYDGVGSTSTCAGTTGNVTKACTISFTVPSDMAAPVYVYYELTNFYQNHRRYVQSRSYPQTMGTIFTDSSSLSACDPLRVNSVNGKVLHPCGLIANSFFNGESFSAYHACLAWVSAQITASPNSRSLPLSHSHTPFTHLSPSMFRHLLPQ